MVSLSQIVARNDDILGVVGLDIQVAELLEDVAHIEHSDTTRTFVIDENGSTLSHPLLDPPERWREPELPLISTLESSDGFDAALHRIKSFPSGSFVTSSNLSYSWQQVPGSNYILVVAGLISSSRTERVLETVPRPGDGTDIQYHDLLPTGGSKLCRHMREIASMQTAALYLTPAAYALPFEHLMAEQATLRTQSFMAFLTDPTRLIANPGLKGRIKNDVTLLSHVVQHWKDLAYSSPLNNYIIRRRIFTQRGVELSYPGAKVEEELDPSKELWFNKAVESPTKVIVSPPRLDPGGAGFIITVSKAVSATNSSGADYLAAVVSADYTLGYFYKILNDSVPDGFCARSSSRCFLVDDRGNMVAHPALARDALKYVNFPSEGQHFTHMEPVIATDVLGHQGFITKQVCRGPGSGRLQRYFQLDAGYTGVLRSTADQCTQYRLAAVPGTNLYLGLVHQPCNSSAFCWCSTLDRTCLDCQSWEQGECECPCECETSVSSYFVFY